MTNKERQKSLDKKKWTNSEKLGRDTSGFETYCFSCPHQTLHNECTATQEEREADSLCAKAWNRMVRA